MSGLAVVLVLAIGSFLQARRVLDTTPPRSVRSGPRGICAVVWCGHLRLGWKAQPDIALHVARVRTGRHSTQSASVAARRCLCPGAGAWHRLLRPCRPSGIKPSHADSALSPSSRLPGRCRLGAQARAGGGPCSRWDSRGTLVGHGVAAATLLWPSQSAGPRLLRSARIPAWVSWTRARARAGRYWASADLGRRGT